MSSVGNQESIYPYRSSGKNWPYHRHLRLL